MLGASGYKTKKDLKASVGRPLRALETSMRPEYNPDGRNSVVGPCAYTDRRWYATVTCADGIIVKVS